MAEFWKAKKDREGNVVHFLHSGFFAEAGAFRLSVTLRGGGCGKLSHIQTPVGKPGVLRYVMPFKLPEGKAFTGNCELSFFFRPEIKGNRFAIRRLALLAT